MLEWCFSGRSLTVELADGVGQERVQFPSPRPEVNCQQPTGWRSVRPPPHAALQSPFCSPPKFADFAKRSSSQHVLPKMPMFD